MNVEIDSHGQIGRRVEIDVDLAQPLNKRSRRGGLSWYETRYLDVLNRDARLGSLPQIGKRNLWIIERRLNRQSREEPRGVSPAIVERHDVPSSIGPCPFPLRRNS